MPMTMMMTASIDDLRRSPQQLMRPDSQRQQSQSTTAPQRLRYQQLQGGTNTWDGVNNAVSGNSGPVDPRFASVANADFSIIPRSDVITPATPLRAPPQPVYNAPSVATISHSSLHDIMNGIDNSVGTGGGIDSSKLTNVMATSTGSGVTGIRRRRVSKSYLDVNYNNNNNNSARSTSIRNAMPIEHGDDTQTIVSELSLDGPLLLAGGMGSHRASNEGNIGNNEYQFRKYAGRRRTRERIARHQQRTGSNGPSTFPVGPGGRSMSPVALRSAGTEGGGGVGTAMRPQLGIDDIDLDDVPITMSGKAPGPGSHVMAELMEHNQKVRQVHDMLHWRADRALPQIDIFSGGNTVFSSRDSVYSAAEGQAVQQSSDPFTAPSGTMKDDGRGRSSVHAQRVAAAQSMSPLRVGRDGSSSLMNNPMMGGKASSVSPPRRMIGPGSILYQELFEEPTPSAAAPFAPFSSAVGPGSSVSSPPRRPVQHKHNPNTMRAPELAPGDIPVDEGSDDSGTNTAPRVSKKPSSKKH